MFKLDNSFELLSSMSPKSTKTLYKQKSKKSPSKLSLKKNLRRSSIFDKKPQLNFDNSVVVLEDSFEENPNTLTTVKVNVNKKDDIVSLSSESISDSQESSNENKFPNVNKWLNDNEKLEDFSEIHSFKHKSYYIDSENESFENSLRKLNINDEVKKPDEFLNESDKSLDDSLENPNLDKNDFFTPVKKGFFEEKEVIDDSLEEDENIEGYENILDDLYGTSWREKRDEILPQSERKPLRKKIEINLPQTERKPSRTNIFGTKKSKIRESVVLRLNNLCDSDTDSDSNISTDSNKNHNSINSEMTRPKNNKKLTKKSPKIFNSSSSSDSSGINISDSDLDINTSLRTRVQKKLFKNNIKDFSSTPKKVLKKPTTTTTTTKNNEKNLKKFEKTSDNKKTVSAEKIVEKKSIPVTKKINKKVEKLKEKKSSGEIENLKENEKFSFLYSLSEHLPSWQSDKEARYFRDNYSKEKENLAKRLFEIFNEKVFKHALPQDTLIEWNPRINKTAGLCYNRRLTKRDGSVHRMCRIVLAPKVLTCAARLRDTLIHEMCHAATWIVNGVLDGHGSQWQAWAHKARSVFPELPAISRCHNYVIETKYTYKCQGCGYSIGRHSKSLDIERKRCGICLGKFDVFVNKKGRGGDLRTELVESKTPKKTPFADFVKEHYKSVRTSNVKHAEAMKLLAAKFQEMKLKNGNGDTKNTQKNE